MSAALTALAYDLQSYDVAAPIVPDTTNTLPRAIDLRTAKTAAVAIGITATNAGTIILLASNSLDTVSWFADPTNDLTVPFSAGVTSLLTNLTVSAAVGFETYALFSFSTNSTISDITFKTASKPY